MKKALTEPAALKIVRCACYTRKSTEEGLEQEFNSLDAQRESAAAFVASQRHEGWALLPDSCDYCGFTGGNVDLPFLFCRKCSGQTIRFSNHTRTGPCPHAFAKICALLRHINCESR